MRRKTVFLDHELDDALRRNAAASGVSQSEGLRRSLRRYLSSFEFESNDDPLAPLVGFVADDLAAKDLAEELDHYAYGVAKGHKRGEGHRRVTAE